MRWTVRRPAATSGIAVTGLVTLTIVFVTVFRGCGGVEIRSLPPAPDTTPTAGAPTSTIAATAVSLPVVPGSTTTSVVAMGGAAHLHGTVTGPEGAAPGATVRVERLVGDAVLPTDATTAADGTWDLPGVAGGRYRVRAFRAPTLVQAEPEIFFLGGTEDRTIDLTVESYTGLTIQPAFAPDPPQVREPVSAVLQLVSRSVGTDGVARAEAVVSVLLDLVDSGGWQLVSQTPALTDSDGRAVFAMTCRRAGPNELLVRVATGEQLTVPAPDCTDPSTTTTTAADSTTTTRA